MPCLKQLARDAVNLLYQLPPEIAVTIWRNWPSGFSKAENPGGSLWLDALFEMSWQMQPGSPLYSRRSTWAGNFSVGLLGEGLFPLLPVDVALGPDTNIPNEHGYPLACYSKLDDVARASVAAIDEILEHSTINASAARTSKLSKPIKDHTMNAIKRDKVFISYCHKDDKFLDDLLLHLKPFERAGLIVKWSDKQIAAGSQWLDEIKSTLATTKVAVMMVSPGFLGSDFIHQQELNPLLKEAEEGGVHILWVPVRASAYKETPLKHYQAVISPDKPLAQMKAERDAAYVKICDEIKKALNP